MTESYKWHPGFCHVASCVPVLEISKNHFFFINFCYGSDHLTFNLSTYDFILLYLKICFIHFFEFVVISISGDLLLQRKEIWQPVPYFTLPEFLCLLKVWQPYFVKASGGHGGCAVIIIMFQVYLPY